MIFNVEYIYANICAGCVICCVFHVVVLASAIICCVVCYMFCFGCGTVVFGYITGNVHVLIKFLLFQVGKRGVTSSWCFLVTKTKYVLLSSLIATVFCPWLTTPNREPLGTKYLRILAIKVPPIGNKMNKARASSSNYFFFNSFFFSTLFVCMM